MTTIDIESSPLRAFHNDPAIKARYLACVERHMAADDLLRGATGSGGKGCAVWCTLDAYDHSRYPIELGIPEWLAHVEDALFEGMSAAKSKTWPRDFLRIINTGADLESAKAPFLVFVLRSTLQKFDTSNFPGVAEVVEGSITLWLRKDIGSEDWVRAAEAAAEAAFGAARAAAKAAFGAAKAAARAAEAASGTAEAASGTAEAASGADALAYDSFADQLLLILKETTP